MSDEKEAPKEPTTGQLFEKLAILWGKVDRHFTDLKPLAEVYTTLKSRSDKNDFVLAKVGSKTDSGWCIQHIGANGSRIPVADAGIEVKLDAIKAIKGLTDQVKSKNDQVVEKIKEAITRLEEYLKKPDEI